MENVSSKKPIKAWHFIQDSRKLGYNDNRKVVAGRTYLYDYKKQIAYGGREITVDNGFVRYETNEEMMKPKLCHRGMHASENILHAFCQGFCRNLLCRVEVSGDIVRGTQKLAGTRRKVLWVLNIEKAAIDAVKEYEGKNARDFSSAVDFIRAHSYLAGGKLEKILMKHINRARKAQIAKSRKGKTAPKARRKT